MKGLFFAALLCLLCFGVVAYYDLNSAAGIALGALWGGVNLYLLKQLLYAGLIAKNYKWVLLMGFIKFPLLYAVAYAVMILESLSPWHFLLGIAFSLLIAPAFLPKFKYLGPRP